MTRSGRAELRVVPAEDEIEWPFQREGVVARAGLLGRLSAIPDDVPLVLLVAPSGYGKTTALSQWSASDARGFAWLTVEEADSDPVALAARIAVELHRVAPLSPEVFHALAVGDRSRQLAALPHLLA